MTASPKHSTAVDLDGGADREVVGPNGAFDFEPDGSGRADCPEVFT